MSFLARPPHPKLRRFVEAICASDDADFPLPCAPVRVVPDGCCELVFSVGSAGFGGELYGTKTRPLLVPCDVPVERIGVRFRPGAAARFFAFDGEPVGDGVFELRALWGRDGGELAERIATARKHDERFELVERALLERLEAAEAPDPLADAVDFAARRLVASSGQSSIGALAAAAGLGERRLERAFGARVGVAPKRLARILRFRAAYDALVRGIPGAQVALDCGYADQSHLLRDFRDLAGAPPREVLAEPPASYLSNRGRRNAASLLSA